MKYSKTTRILGSLVIATGLTFVICILLIISKLFDLLPFPWGEVANIAYGIIILTIIIYILISKVSKEDDED